MFTYHIIIAILIAVIMVLELILIQIDRNKRIGYKRVEKNIDIGVSMTIGSRDVQEDAVDTFVNEFGTLSVLADGGGKLYGGRIASRIVVETCVDLFQDYNAFHNPQYYFRKAFHISNTEILKAVGDEGRGIASAVCAMVCEGYLYYASVGNVKLAVYRDGSFVPISTGQTIAVLAEKRFQEGKISRQDALEMLENQRLTNYLGKDGFQDIELFDAPIHLMTHDIIILMSDGVYDQVGVRDLEMVLAKNMSCQQKAFEIIEMVNQCTDEIKDNASILLLGIGNGGRS